MPKSSSNDEPPHSSDLPNTLQTDETTSVAKLKEVVETFVAQRNWHQFHSPKNLSMSLSIEAAELMEHFQWISVEESIALKENQKALDEIGEELADVLSYSLALSNVLGLDLTTILLAKMEKNRTKYPIDQFKGRYGNRQHLAPPQE